MLGTLLPSLIIPQLCSQQHALAHLIITGSWEAMPISVFPIYHNSVLIKHGPTLEENSFVKA